MGKRASVGGEGAKKRLTQASANRLVTDVSFIIERRQHEQQEAEIKKICEQLRENPRLIPGVITLIECGGAGYEDNLPRGIGTQGNQGNPQPRKPVVRARSGEHYCGPESSGVVGLLDGGVPRTLGVVRQPVHRRAADPGAARPQPQKASGQRLQNPGGPRGRARPHGDQRHEDCPSLEALPELRLQRRRPAQRREFLERVGTGGVSQQCRDPLPWDEGTVCILGDRRHSAGRPRDRAHGILRTGDPVVLLVPAAGWALRGRKTPDIGRRKRSFPKPETAN